MADQRAPATERQLVIFNLNGHSFGMDIAAVREILRHDEVIPVAGAPEFIEGVCHLGGKPVPVMDLRTRLAMPQGERTDAARTIVLRIQGQDIGVVVDSVTEVRRADESLIQPVSAEAAGHDADCLEGVLVSNEVRVQLIDVSKVISAEQAAQIADLAGGAATAA